MIEMSSIINTVDLSTVVPLFAAVYQIYLNKPIVAWNKSEVSNALREVKEHGKITELPAGSHDVTPEGAQLNYTVIVQDQGGGDNIGYIQVTSPEGFSFVRHETNSGISSTSLVDRPQETLSNPGGQSTIIGEAITSGMNSGFKLFGVILYRPKGQAVFPK